MHTVFNDKLLLLFGRKKIRFEWLHFSLQNIKIMKMNINVLKIERVSI
jgi:hypothetical protein